MLPPYTPEAYVNFADTEPREAMLAAIADVGSRLGRSYPLHVAGQEIETPDTIKSIMPASNSTVVGFVSMADVEQVEQAIQSAHDMFGTWSRYPADARSKILIKASAIMRRRLYELSAWQCYEESKPWLEAYADVCEAIDFLEFYAREMLRLDGPQPVTPFPGEDNEYRYVSLGVVVVIPPWNFPLAICCGMTAAALVTGNTVVLKPAIQSSVVAALMNDIFLEAGLPPGVLNFVPGDPQVIGDYMVAHPLTRVVAFTGSKKIGLRIYETCGQVSPGQIWLKRAILEMGGKDCIIVDETADLDAAAEGVVQAAFGFQGQKCSACSRLIAQKDIYADLIARVVEKTQRLSIGNPTTDDNPFMGAVIDQTAYDKIHHYIEIGKQEGRAVLTSTPVPPGGYFVPPTIFADVAPEARLAQEEVFGPVLAVIKANDFEQALSIANNTEYGLTGGLYSGDRARLERARHDFQVGNLYFNRKCTGALVDVQPFGGFNMSGTNSKAGSRDYLQLFLQGKSITERF